jgi:hypothetical protein
MHIQDWHPECDEASRKEAREEGGDYEFNPYDHERPTVSESVQSKGD